MNEEDRLTEAQIDAIRKIVTTGTFNPGRIFVSRYTPGLENGENVNFKIGEIVDYRMRNGEEYSITIDSELMQQDNYIGYEAIFPDDGKRYFVPSKGIYNWEGKRIC